MQNDRYAHLRVGACDIAVPVLAIELALPLPPGGVTPLPRRDGALAGLIELAGTAIPLVALDRWVALGESSKTAHARIVILRNDTARIAICADALVGVIRVDPASVRPVCHTADGDELFEAIVPATAARPLLCVLEVARLMTLCAAWCEQAEWTPTAPTPSVARRHTAATRAFALFVIGDQHWAVLASAVRQLLKAPPADMAWPGRRVAGIGPWGARKLPFVDLAARGTAGRDGERPWMAVLTEGPLAIGMLVSRFEQMVRIGEADKAEGSGNALQAGIASVAGVGMVSILDVQGLFREVPESSISLEPAPAARSAAAHATPSGTARDAPTEGEKAKPEEASHYLVFEADRTYASPGSGVLGVAALPPKTIDDLAGGRPASLVWRGQTLGVVPMPALNGGPVMTDPRVAVILRRPNAMQAHSAVAVRSLRNWITASAAQRSALRQREVGELSMVTPSGGSARGTSLVVVDLAQMAYLLD